MANQFINDAPDVRAVAVNQVPEGWFIMDIGEITARRFSESLEQCRTIVWNGPMGVFEMSNFERGSRAIALAMADATTKGAFSLVGGGDSVAAINAFGLADQVSYVSTGGGALLEYMEGKTLPGVAAIMS